MENATSPDTNLARNHSPAAGSEDQNLLKDAKSLEMKKIHSDPNQTDFHLVRHEESHPLESATSPDTNLARNHSPAAGKNRKDWKNHPARKRMLEIKEKKAASKPPEPDSAQKLNTEHKVHTDGEAAAALAEMPSHKMNREAKSAILKDSSSTRAACGAILKANAKLISPVESMAESTDSPSDKIATISVNINNSNNDSFNGEQAVNTRKRERSEFSRDPEMPVKKQKQKEAMEDMNKQLKSDIHKTSPNNEKRKSGMMMKLKKERKMRLLLEQKVIRMAKEIAELRSIFATTPVSQTAPSKPAVTATMVAPEPSKAGQQQEACAVNSDFPSDSSTKKERISAKDDQYWSEEEMKKRDPQPSHYPTNEDDDYHYQFHHRQKGYL